MKRINISFILIGFVILMTSGCFETSYIRKINYVEKEVYSYPKISTQEIIWTKDTAGEINSLALSDDGFYLFVGNDDNKAILFNNTSSEPIWTCNTGSPVRSVSTSPNGTYYVAGCENGRVMLFNTTTSNPLWNYDIGDRITDTDFSINNKYLVAGTADGYIHLFDLTGPMWSYKAVEIVLSIDISYDANTIVVGGYDTGLNGKICVFNRTGDLLWSDQSLDILYTKVTMDGNYICGAGEEYAYMFNRVDSTPIWSKTVGSLYYGLGVIYGMEMSRNGKTIVFANQWGLYEPTRVRICNFDGSTRESRSYTWGTSRWNAAVSGNGRYIAYLNSFNSMRIRKRISDISFIGAGSHDLEEDISASAYNYNGSYLALGGENGKITVLFNNIELSPFNLTTDAEIPDIDGNFTLYWEDPGNADNFTIYSYNSSITQINKSLDILDVQYSRSFAIANLTNGIYYYLVFAKNEKYSLSSNCLKVEVHTYKNDKAIIGYALYPLFSMVLIGSMYLAIKNRKLHRKK